VNSLFDLLYTIPILFIPKIIINKAKIIINIEVWDKNHVFSKLFDSPERMKQKNELYEMMQSMVLEFMLVKVWLPPLQITKLFLIQACLPAYTLKVNLKVSF
jgi:hypothetical protein